jgi:hypothetical protein
MLPDIKRKAKVIKETAKERWFSIPILAKKNIVVASLRPKPPIDIGSMLIADITGTNIKK